MRYKETIAQWETVFKRENMMVFAYSENENIIERLAQGLISLDIRSSQIGGYAQKKSLGASAIEARRLINRELSERRPAGASKLHFGSILAHMRHAIKKRTIANSSDRLRFSEDQLQRVNAIAEIDRRWLEDVYRIHLGDRRSNGDVR